jgi:5'-nucleotidase
MTHRPLILITNDDGIESPGLHAAAEAVADLGELLIVAPSTQRTGAGRSYPPVNDKAIYQVELPLSTGHPAAYKADLSPAQAVMTAVVELAERPIDLCISGINYGENLGSGVTISGTIGAAIEAATFGIPALALSLETPKEFHLNHSTEIDFGVAAHFTRLFAQRILARGLLPGVDFLKIDIPASATAQTPWRSTTVSRHRYYMPVHSGRKQLHDQLQIGYQANIDPDTIEPESDIYIFSIERQVAVSPMTIDLTAPIHLADITRFYRD